MGRYKEATATPTSDLILNMSPKITLVYFNNNVRARTECARLTLAYGAVPHTFADCQTFFGCSFPEAKAAGKLPFGQLPIVSLMTRSSPSPGLSTGLSLRKSRLPDLF